MASKLKTLLAGTAVLVAGAAVNTAHAGAYAVAEDTFLNFSFTGTGVSNFTNPSVNATGTPSNGADFTPQGSINAANGDFAKAHVEPVSANAATFLTAFNSAAGGTVKTKAEAQAISATTESASAVMGFGFNFKGVQSTTDVQKAAAFSWNVNPVHALAQLDNAAAGGSSAAANLSFQIDVHQTGTGPDNGFIWKPASGGFTVIQNGVSSFCNPGNIGAACSDHVGWDATVASAEKTSASAFVDTPGTTDDAVSGTGGYIVTLTWWGTNGTNFGGNVLAQANAAATNTTAVPEPASLAILGASLIGVGALRRRRRQG